MATTKGHDSTEETASQRLAIAIEDQWSRIKQGEFFGYAGELVGDVDVARGMTLLKAVFTEMFHYTRHNSINQAVAAGASDINDHRILRFCYEHAKEELGHELMLIRDLTSIGLLADGEQLPDPIPETQALVAYLYDVSRRRGGVARLGYSFWAEDAYGHISEPVRAAREHLSLADRNLTFLVAHQAIDAHHSAEVHALVDRYGSDPDDFDEIADVAMTSLALTGAMLDAVARKVRGETMINLEESVDDGLAVARS